MGHKVVHLVVVGDSDAIVFALELVPVQLTRKVGGVHFWSAAP